MENMNHLTSAAERFEMRKMTEEIIRLTDPDVVRYDDNPLVHEDVTQRVSPVMETIRNLAESILYMVK